MMSPVLLSAWWNGTTDTVDGSGIAEGNHLIGIASSRLGRGSATRWRANSSSNAWGFPRLPADRRRPERVRRVADTDTHLYPLHHKSAQGFQDQRHCPHYPGGGLLENIPRILPRGCKASIHLNRWKRQPIFDILREAGNVERDEMYAPSIWGSAWLWLWRSKNQKISSAA